MSREKIEGEKPEKAIGHVSEMSEPELVGKHIDNESGWVFDTVGDYEAFLHPAPEPEPDPED